MRFTMGRLIREATGEERDALIAAPGFNDGREWIDEDDGLMPGCGCLVGTLPAGETKSAAKSLHHQLAMRAPRSWDDDVGDNGHIAYDEVRWSAAPASMRYPKAVRRYGKDRVVRAIKLRAARLNGSSPEAIREMTSTPAVRVGA